MKKSYCISGCRGLLRPSIRQIRCAIGLLMLSTCASVYAASDALGDALDDTLNIQAEKSDKASTRLLLDIEQHQKRIFTVGEYGHILYSDDQGDHWQQADVPTIVTLNAIDFPDSDLHSSAKDGWAVGHDGVVLKTSNQGASWHKQLDGFAINQLVIDKAQQLLVETAQQQSTGRQNPEISIEDLEFALEDAQSFAKEGASRPLLDVLFLDGKTGFAIGAYGLIIHTRDGGQNWQSWHDRLDNSDGFHLNAIRKIGSSIYIVGEAGMVYRSDDSGESWKQLYLPYEGSLFGIVGSGPDTGSDTSSGSVSDSGSGAGSDKLLVYGLSGNTWCSTDGGDSWVSADHGVTTTLSAGDISSVGTVLLAGFSEVLLKGDIASCSFAPTLNLTQAPYSALLQQNNHLITVGVSGVKKIALAHSDQSEK